MYQTSLFSLETEVLQRILNYVLNPSLPLLKCLSDASPDTFDNPTTSSIIYCGFILQQRQLEACGRAFHECYERRSQSEEGACSEAPKSSPHVSSEEGDSKEQEKQFSRKSVKGPSHGWLKTAIEGKNLYECLEIEEYASQEDIQKQYRVLAKKYHPDKQKKIEGKQIVGDGVSLNEEERTKHFLKIQQAYEILSNDEYRRQYDSALPFDDFIPDAADVVDETFYDIFGPVFSRNSRWSTIKPVPTLGDADKPLKEVKRFYDFWFDFVSWRTFNIHDEYDMHEAGYRLERRWMERENRKIHRKYLKDENTRIQNLVSLAYSCDPRIQWEKRLLEEKRKEAKEARRRQKSAAEDEKQRLAALKLKEEEEAKHLEEESKRLQSEARKVERNRIKQKRRQLRQLAVPLSKQIDSYDLQLICTNNSEAELQNLCLKICEAFDISPSLLEIEERNWSAHINWDDLTEEKKSCAVKIVEKHMEQHRIKKEGKTENFEKAENKVTLVGGKETANAKAEVIWTKEELSLLAKAVQRFPGGTTSRWRRVAEYVGTKTAEEVIAKSKELSTKGNAYGVSVARENTVVDAQKDVPKSEGNETPDSRSTKSSENDEAKVIPPSTSGSTINEAEENGNLKTDDWTAAQQKALEDALLKYPQSLPMNERWASIAAAVDGKNKRECAERYKQICALLSAGRKKKAGAT